MIRKLYVYILGILILSLSLFLAACGKDSSQSKVRPVSFQSSMKKAEMVSEYRKIGNQFYENGRYNDALVEFDKALSYSFSRLDNAVIYENIAATYVSMGNAALASQYYLKASEATMNETRREMLREKAALLIK